MDERFLPVVGADDADEEDVVEQLGADLGLDLDVRGLGGQGARVSGSVEVRVATLTAAMYGLHAAKRASPGPASVAAGRSHRPNLLALSEIFLETFRTARQRIV